MSRTLLLLTVALCLHLPAAQASDYESDYEGDGGCSASKGGGGFGGNHVSCRLTCKPGTAMEISVRSSDSVTVSGVGQCSDATADCSGVQTCKGTGAPATRAGSGSCEGRSDETWRSSLSVACGMRGTPCTVSITCPPGAEPEGLLLFLVDHAGNAIGSLCTASECLPTVPTHGIPTVPADETQSEIWRTYWDARAWAWSALEELQRQLDEVAQAVLTLLRGVSLDEALAAVQDAIDDLTRQLTAILTPEEDHDIRDIQL